jgi:DNA-binding NarL/FixJ family response regulator
MSGGIRIAVIDDHPMFRQGLVWTLKHAKGMTVVGEGGSAGEALNLAATLLPDVLLLDLNLRGADCEGIAVGQLIKQSLPQVKIIVLTVSESEQHVAAALKAGASGYVLKGVSGAEIVQIVRDVHAGAQHVSPDLAARILAQAQAQQQAPVLVQPRPALTMREEQILTLVSRGLTNKEVARDLQISEKTVKHYMTGIMQKLGARNRTEAVLYRDRVAAPSLRSGSPSTSVT